MILIRIQISFFTPDAVYGNFQSVIKELIERCGETLDADPITLPTFNNAPVDIPKIILRSNSNERELLIKSQRIDVAYVKPFEDGISDDEREVFQNDALKWIIPFLSERKIGVNRVGIVMQRGILPTDTSPAEYIAQKYCRDYFQRQPFGNAKSFELHCLKEYEYLEKRINSWVRIQTINVIPSNKTIVGLLNDINHIPLSDDLSENEIKEFVNNANTEMLKIINHYKV